MQAPADGWLLTEQRLCEKCGRPRLLLARPGRLLLCSDCWRGFGSPFPVKPGTSAEVHAATVRIHHLMLERGGMKLDWGRQAEAPTEQPPATESAI